MHRDDWISATASLAICIKCWIIMILNFQAAAVNLYLRTGNIQDRAFSDLSGYLFMRWRVPGTFPLPYSWY